jgi:hypothetical protein
MGQGSEAKPQRPRESIAGYRLVRRIGAGGMAEVWLGARQTAGGTTKLAAVKVPAKELIGDDRYRRLFRREAELGAQLEHGNIVKTLDEGEDDGLSYLVMEYVDGVALSRIQSQLLYAADEATRIQICSHVVLQVTKALSFAHRVRSDAGNPLGIVHRDVSPQNVLVSQAGEVKLGDWGVSYLAQAAMTASTRSFIHGKPRYMAPEQLAGENRDPRIDLYSLGAVFQELLDGRPFRSDVPEASMLVDAISGRRPKMVRAIPAELDRLLARLLERDPGKRHPDARAVIEELRAWSGARDMSEELGEIVRGVQGVAGPRTRPSVSSTGLVVPPIVPTVENTPVQAQGGAGAPPVEPTVRFDTKDGGQAAFGLVIDPTVGIDGLVEEVRTTPFDATAVGPEGTVLLPEPAGASEARTTALPPPEPLVAAPPDAPAEPAAPPEPVAPPQTHAEPRRRPSWPPVEEAPPQAWGTPATAWPDPSRDSWTHAMAKPQAMARRRRSGALVAVVIVVLVLATAAGAGAAWWWFMIRGS